MCHGFDVSSSQYRAPSFHIILFEESYCIGTTAPLKLIFIEDTRMSLRGKLHGRLPLEDPHIVVLTDCGPYDSSAMISEKGIFVIDDRPCAHGGLGVRPVKQWLSDPSYSIY